MPRIKELQTIVPTAGDYIAVDQAATGGITGRVPLGQANGVALLNAGGMPITANGTPVVEYGTNSNGAYIRFADGTQICWQSHPDGWSAVFSGNDPDYRYRTKNWSFPAAFSASPVVLVAGDNSSSYMEQRAAYSVTSTGCTLEVGAYKTDPIVVVFYSVAIGRWF